MSDLKLLALQLQKETEKRVKIILETELWKITTWSVWLRLLKPHVLELWKFFPLNWRTSRLKFLLLKWKSQLYLHVHWSLWSATCCNQQEGKRVPVLHFCPNTEHLWYDKETPPNNQTQTFLALSTRFLLRLHRAGDLGPQERFVLLSEAWCVAEMRLQWPFHSSGASAQNKAHRLSRTRVWHRSSWHLLWALWNPGSCRRTVCVCVCLSVCGCWCVNVIIHGTTLKWLLMRKHHADGSFVCFLLWFWMEAVHIQQIFCHCWRGTTLNPLVSVKKQYNNTDILLHNQLICQ